MRGRRWFRSKTIAGSSASPRLSWAGEAPVLTKERAEWTLEDLLPKRGRAAAGSAPVRDSHEIDLREAAEVPSTAPELTAIPSAPVPPGSLARPLPPREPVSTPIPVAERSEESEREPALAGVGSIASAGRAVTVSGRSTSGSNGGSASTLLGGGQSVDLTDSDRDRNDSGEETVIDERGPEEPEPLQPEVEEIVPTSTDDELLVALAGRVRWLSARMIDRAFAQAEPGEALPRPTRQAEAASASALLTSLWFDHLDARDRISVSPRLAPPFHAIKYLLGALDTEHVMEGGSVLPSLLDDGRVDEFEVSGEAPGEGALAAMLAAAVDRYVRHHPTGGSDGPTESPRFVSVIAESELDSGSLWEAISDPAVSGLGNVLLVVEIPRGGSDRLTPSERVAPLQRMFLDNGWHVLEARYGARLETLFGRTGGPLLHRYLDDMPNSRFEQLIGHSGSELRELFLADAPPGVERALNSTTDAELAETLFDLGGHDFAALRDAFVQADEVEDRPSVVFAHTVPGWGLPRTSGPGPALLDSEQLSELRRSAGLTEADEWVRPEPASPLGRLCASTADRLGEAEPAVEVTTPRVPERLGVEVPAVSSTHGLFAELMTRLADEEVATHVVTTSSGSGSDAGLGGWINKRGRFTAESRVGSHRRREAVDGSVNSPGQHLELGPSESSFFRFLSQLGAPETAAARPLIPVGSQPDSATIAALGPLVGGLRRASRFVVAGTPSGVTLSREPGANRSVMTPSIGVELPGLDLVEPAYGEALDWLLCDALDAVARRRHSTYLRLTTRPIDQQPFIEARERMGEVELRRQVIAGGYRLVEGSDMVDGPAPVVQIVASGAVMPEVLEASAILHDEGVAANVIDVTSIGRLYDDWRSVRREGYGGAVGSEAFHLAALIPLAERRAPVVTVHDAASHAMAWLGSVFGAQVVSLGVDQMTVPGARTTVYEAADLTPGHIANAGLLGLELE